MSTEPAGAVEAGEAGEAGRHLFGDRLPLAAAYARMLVTTGVEHGHLGPREAARVWSRHLVNGALVADLLPSGARVVDVGSGAGLPGVPIAIRRPDLSVVLLEPMQRRIDFLRGVVAELPLPNADVVRGRAPDVADEIGRLDWVTARAVAPLERLVRWCLPLLAPGGTLLAMKGATVDAEIGHARSALTALGAEVLGVDVLGVGTAGADPGSPTATDPGSIRVVTVRRSG